jgi:glycosyltransferase involved in cell wall biosynthesis
LRLTWLSNAPWTSTGYGQQTALFTTKLVQEGFDIGVIANYGHQGSVINWKGVQVFGNSYHPYCLDIMHSHSKNFNADAMITLMDLQVFEPDKLLGTRWIAWTPIDHHNAPPLILENASKADHILSMSKHGSDLMTAAGIENDFIPCAYDGEIYKPMDKKQAREDMKLPQDKFIVGMVAMNKGAPSRKAFHANIAAFAALHAKYPDTVLYLHTADGTRGGEVELLTAYCAAVGLTFGYFDGKDVCDKDVIFANQYGLALGYEPYMMAKIYNSMDVLTSVTRGEGFGIPIIEAQACGTPVIVGDWSAMSELCHGGWKVERSEAEAYFTGLMAWQFLPHIDAIAARMEAAYLKNGNSEIKRQAIKGAKSYEAEKVFKEKWLPALARIQTKLQDKKNVNLENNLAVLR